MSVLGIFLILFAVIVILLTIIYLRKVSYWKRHKVDLISIWQFLRKNRYAPCGVVLSEYYQDMYRERKPFKVLEGLLMSTVIVQDLDAIKQIMVTNFDCFPDRGVYTNPRDPLSTSILRLECDKWSSLRQKLTPALSPAKIKSIFPTFLKVGSELAQFLKDECCNGSIQMEMYDLCARYTTDIIGSVIYGIECNSLKDPKTEFRVEGSKSVTQLLNPLVDQIAVRCSTFLRFINFRISTKETEEFFTRIVKETLEYREKHNVRCLDLMDTMIVMRKEMEDNGDPPMTTEQIAGQMFAFFQAGFETSASTMRFALYELAKNPEIQARARQEILEIIANHNNKLTYEGIREMKYLKQIIMETLRRYPSVPCIARLCRSLCKVETPYGDLTIQPNTTILIPFYGIHHNPDLYPEPEEFRPERFTNEKIAQRPACSFLPFGAGPRVCLAELFAKIQIAVGLSALLAQFKVSMCEKTPAKLSFDPASGFLLSVKDGVYLNVEKL